MRVRQTLVSLAVLLDRTTLAEKLALPDPNKDPNIPAVLADSIAAFALRATSGACDGLADARIALEKMLGGQLTPKEIDAQRERLLADPYLFAVPCIGLPLAREFDATLPIHKIYRALDAGRTAEALALLDSLHRGRRGATRASVTWEAIYSEAWATAKAGNPAGARAQLTEALENIANMSPFTLDQPAQAAGLRRGLALLVSLTDSSADPAAYKRWSRLSNDLTAKR